MFFSALTDGSLGAAFPVAQISAGVSNFTFWFAAIVFVVTFVLVASEKVHKTTAVLVGAALMLLFVLPPHGAEKPQLSKDAEALVIRKAEAAKALESVKKTEDHKLSPREKEQLAKTATLQKNTFAFKEAERYAELDNYSKYVNFDVIFTLAGMMVIVNILSKTGLFQYIAIKAVKLAKGYPARTLVLLVLATAFLSAFLDNVTTVLLVVPVTFVVASSMKVSPMPFVIAETLASNIGGTATLIGDPPNLIIGSMVGLSFSDFMVNLAPFVLAVLLIYCVCLYVYYNRKLIVTVEQRARIMEMDEKSAITDAPTLIKAGIIMLLTIVGFLVHGVFHIQPSVVAMTGAAFALAFCKVNVDHMLEKIEWGTLFFFIGLFIVVEGAVAAGVIEQVGSFLRFTVNWHPLIIILTVMWVCGIAVAAVNNVSFTAVAVTIVLAFLNTVPAFQGNVPLQHLMWWGIALAVCFGGNFTLLGAAANLVVAGLSEQSGNKISFGTFSKYAAPVTVGTLICSSIYITIRYFQL